jgi:hypothetical protein
MRTCVFERDDFANRGAEEDDTLTEQFDRHWRIPDIAVKCRDVPCVPQKHFSSP